MKNIMLVCNAGMSTSLLVKKMQDYAKKENIEVHIWASSLAEVDENVQKNKIDIILVGPQVKHMVGKLEEKYSDKFPISDINMLDYGRMNGEKVLEDALAIIGD